MAENLLRGSFFLHLSLIDKEHAASDLPGEAHLVGDDGHGHTVFRQFPHNLQNLSDHFRIQRRCRLVKKQYPGIHRHGSDDGNPLFLPSGQRRRIVIRLILQPDPLQKLHGFLIRLFLRHPPGADRRQCNIPSHRFIGKQVKMLEHHSHLTADFIDICILGSDLLVIKPYLSRCGDLQEIQTAEKGGFSGSGRSDNNHLFSLIDML